MMDLDRYFAEHPSPMAERTGDPASFRSGFVALIGRPNAGKSTLINALLGKDIAITSATSQTTRKKMCAILNGPDYQIVFVDTPGLHKPHDVLGDKLNSTASNAVDDSDMAAMLIDASQDIGKGDLWVSRLLGRTDSPKICVLSKVDLVDDEQLEKQFDKAKDLCDWSAIVALSARTGYNLDAFVDEIYQLLPMGPLWFPSDMDSDQTDDVIVSEFIREKILRDFKDEIPHAVGVYADSLEYVKKKDLYRIYATIYVERESQKAILIGKNGSSIKRIGVQSRSDLEKIFDCRVYLDLSVKVKKNWRSDETQIRRFGYID